MSARLGIDVGGTFTDLLLLDERSGDVRLLKTPSTPEDQSVGIVDGTTALLARAGVRPGDVRTVLHGTTVSTNIVLEEKGAKVGLLVTENFEQVLHLARSQTPGPLAGWMIMQKPDPLADLEHTRGVPERIDARGRILRPLDEAKAREAIRELLDAGVESITVSLLHSYANDAHEQRLKALVVETGADVPVSLSSEILPEFREYERTLVTVMNAYVRPRMRHYLQRLDDKLRAVDLSAGVHIVRSDGGLMSIARASDSPAHTMLSGPAGGVSGAAFVAGLAGASQRAGVRHGGHLDRRLPGARRCAHDLPADDPGLLPHQGAVGGGPQRRGRGRLDRPRAHDRGVAGRAAERGGGAGAGLLRQGRGRSRR